MPKPVGLGPRLVAIQQAGITKEEAGKQIQAQAAAGVPPEQMVLTNPKTAVVVPLNIPAAQPQPMQETVQEKRGIDFTNLAIGWNSLMDKLGLPSWSKMALDSKGRAMLGQNYKTNQYDGTVGELEKGR